MPRPYLLTMALLLSIAVSVHAKEPIMTPPETPVLGELDPYLIQNIYHSKNAEASLADVQEDPEFLALVKKHHLKLWGGPMLGCVTHDAAKVWLRTTRPAKVRVELFDTDEKPVASDDQSTSAARDYTAVLQLAGLKPWTEYRYNVLVDGEAVLSEPARFRTNPRSGQAVAFSVGFGGGARYVPDKERMWDTIASFRPHAFLFLGDNIYIDQPLWRGKQRALYYRRQLRPEFQRLTSQAAAYAIWDDHDFGANDVSGGLDPQKPDWKIPAWNVFRENWVNPYYGGGGEQPGCWFDFSIGDGDFFMTDGRYYRSFKDGTMLGPVQKKWLLKKLSASKATFKVIASGTLWTEHADKGGADSWWGVKAEREEIFGLIDREKIPGVILISADRHRTDVYKIERPRGYDLYEFETSKLTNNHTHGTKPQALFSYNKGNFFGMLNFDLSKADPEMTFECITIENEKVYSLTLQRSQLEAP